MMRMSEEHSRALVSCARRAYRSGDVCRCRELLAEAWEAVGQSWGWV